MLQSGTEHSDTASPLAQSCCWPREPPPAPCSPALRRQGAEILARARRCARRKRRLRSEERRTCRWHRAVAAEPSKRARAGACGRKTGHAGSAAGSPWLRRLSTAAMRAATAPLLRKGGFPSPFRLYPASLLPPVWGSLFKRKSPAGARLDRAVLLPQTSLLRNIITEMLRHLKGSVCLFVLVGWFVFKCLQRNTWTWTWQRRPHCKTPGTWKEKPSAFYSKSSREIVSNPLDTLMLPPTTTKYASLWLKNI